MGPKRTFIGILGLFRGMIALQNRFRWLKWVILFVVPQSLIVDWGRKNIFRILNILGIMFSITD